MIAGGVLTILSIVASFTSLLFRHPRIRDDNDDKGDTPTDIGISIVVACHDNASELERNLPLLLQQQYTNFEVIVVDESSTDDTDDVLKQLKAKYANLYTTFIPESSHYLSRRKLALTVGVKAAKFEWIVFVDADSRPSDQMWLSQMASQCGKRCDMVMGYTNYSPDSSLYYRYFRFVAAVRNMSLAQHSLPYASGGCTIAIRRDVFMRGNGFVKDLEYLRGEYDFLVNEYAKLGRVGVLISAVMLKDAPDHRSWVNSHIFYMETRRHLARSKRWRVSFLLDALLLRLALVADVTAIVVASVLSLWVLLGAACGSLVILWVLRSLIAHRACQSLGERFPVWLSPLMDLRLSWTRLALHLRYRASDKYDFIRK